jgi:hypothetical protein
MAKKKGTAYPHLVSRKPVLWGSILGKKKSFFYFMISLLARRNGIQPKRSQKFPGIFRKEV